MGAVLMLPAGRGRRPYDDSRRVFDLFPVGRGKSDGAWLYAIGFTDGRVKLGIATRPRSRMHSYWGAVGGAIAWAHLAGRAPRIRRNGHCPAEMLALQMASACSVRLGRSEYFRELSKADAIRCLRDGIRAAEPTEAKAV
jgi:hypothetical protein